MISHLTRMKQGRVCAAGIDYAANRHIRPESRSRYLHIDDTSEYGGPIGIGTVVDLGPVRLTGARPAIEDHEFDITQLNFVRQLNPGEFEDALSVIADDSLESIFGRDLEHIGHTWATKIGTGAASLGCIIPNHRLHVDEIPSASNGGPVRAWVTIEGRQCRLPITDLRLYQYDASQRSFQLNRWMAAWVRNRLNSGTSSILSVGLSRAYARPGDDVKRHWLQLNNVYFRNDPYWIGAPARARLGR